MVPCNVDGILSYVSILMWHSLVKLSPYRYIERFLGLMNHRRRLGWPYEKGDVVPEGIHQDGCVPPPARAVPASWFITRQMTSISSISSVLLVY